MIYITGDIHGDLVRMQKIAAFAKRHNTSPGDTMILLGDTGLNFYEDMRDMIRKNFLAEIPLTFVCIRGNHEIRPENIPSYKTVKMFGNYVYMEENYPNIIFLIDGNEYKIEGKSFLAVGGAFSVDKQYRLLNRLPWFGDEQPSEEERENILKNVTGLHYDVVLSHTCPYSWQPTELFLPNINQDKVDRTTEEWLEEIKNSITFDKWYFGHFHGNKEVEEEKYEMLFDQVKTIT